MNTFAGKVAVVTGAGSGIGQALAVELGRAGAKVAISDVDTEGLAHTEEQLKAIGAAFKSDRLDVTEREAVPGLRRRGQRPFRQGQPDLQQCRHHVHRIDIEDQPVQGHRTGDRRRLLGRGERHQGVPAPPDRLRRRARRQHLQRASACSRRPGRRPTSQPSSPSGASPRRCIRRWRAPATRCAVTTVHPGGIKTAIARNATGGRGARPRRTRQAVRRAAGQDQPRSAPRSIILDGVRKNKARVLVGTDAKALDLMVRVAGPNYQRLFPWRRRIRHGARLSAAASLTVSGRADARPASRPPPPAGRRRLRTCRRISTRAAVSSTPATSLIASNCRSLSALRRYSGTTFSARISAGLPSASATRSPGVPGSAVVVHPAVSCPARIAANIVAPSGNSRGSGSRQRADRRRVPGARRQPRRRGRRSGAAACSSPH